MSAFPAIRLRGTPAEQYDQVLRLWHQAAEQQLAALDRSDWSAFQEALEYKNALLAAWAESQTDTAHLWSNAPEALRRQWEEQIQEIQTLDERIQRVVQTLRDEVRQHLKQFGEQRRALRRYYELPRDLTPAYFDKKF